MQGAEQYDHGGLYEDPSGDDRKGSGQDQGIGQQMESNDRSERVSQKEVGRDGDVANANSREERRSISEEGRLFSQNRDDGWEALTKAR